MSDPSKLTSNPVQDGPLQKDDSGSYGFGHEETD